MQGTGSESNPVENSVATGGEEVKQVTDKPQTKLNNAQNVTEGKEGQGKKKKKNAKKKGDGSKGGGEKKDNQISNHVDQEQKGNKYEEQNTTDQQNATKTSSEADHVKKAWKKDEPKPVKVRCTPTTNYQC